MSDQSSILIRPATADDAASILYIHVASIREGCANHYTARQIDAWAGSKRIDQYRRIIDEGRVLVATVEARVVGFGELDESHHEIRVLFVEPARFGQGIGGHLLHKLERTAHERGSDALSVRSSLNAVRFYERCGFERIKETTAHLTKDVELRCMLMRKTLQT